MKIFFAAPIIIAMVLGTLNCVAQDTLPNFTLKNKGGGRIVISWVNNYDNIIQLAVQRSSDSIRKFSTVYSATSPELPLNGLSDIIVPGTKVYYRIFYVLRSGMYYFSKSKQPQADSIVASLAVKDNARDQIRIPSLVNPSADNPKLPLSETKKNPPETTPVKIMRPRPVIVEPEIMYSIVLNDSAYRKMLTAQLKSFRDSILNKTKDTLQQVGLDTIILKQYLAPFSQRASQYIFTDRDGYMVVNLPDAGRKKYDVLIMEEDETPVFELKNIKEPYFTIDKSNFYHGGLYKFIIYENGRIKERKKIFLPRD